MNATQIFQERSESILRKLDIVYDMLQADRMPKEMLDLVMKLSRRVDHEYEALAYHADNVGE